MLLFALFGLCDQALASGVGDLVRNERVGVQLVEAFVLGTACERRVDRRAEISVFEVVADGRIECVAQVVDHLLLAHFGRVGQLQQALGRVVAVLAADALAQRRTLDLCLVYKRALSL